MRGYLISICVLKPRGLAHLVALGLVSMMLHHACVNTVVPIDFIGMLRTDCSVAHLPCTYLARCKLKSINVVTQETGAK